MTINCIARTKQQESYSVIIQALRGEPADYIKYKDYDQISAHSLMKGYTTPELGHLIDELRLREFLDGNDGILVCDISIKRLLSNEVEVFVIPFKQETAERVFINAVEGVDRVLFSQLVEIRKKLSGKSATTPVSIFSGCTLEESAERKPASKQGMANIGGVGNYRLRRYCPAFLETIQNYKAKIQ